MRWILLQIALMLMFSISVFGQGERKYIRQGNKDYTKGEFGNSEVAYRKALEKQQRSYEANFNLGDALYKQGKFQEAADQFKILATTTEDKAQLSRVYHNLGNSYIKSLKQQKDPKEVEAKLKEGIEAYKNALRVNPNDEETRYNLLYAQKLLQSKQGGGSGNDENKDKQDKSDKKDQNKNEKDNQQDQQDQKSQENDKDSKENKDQPNKISKEDAKRILESMENDEKNLQQKLNKIKAQANPIKVEKDW